MTVSSGFPVWPGGGWETVQLIGRGSYGAVYEIRRELFGSEERSAMKVISVPQSDSDIKELFSEGFDRESVTETFHDHMKSVVSEYTLMRRLDGSANVVNCDDIQYIQHDDGIGWDIYIRMELLTPLIDALEKKPSETQAIRIGRDIASALFLCAQNGIVHRDIKPANVFVSKNGDYKLGDFGIAKVIARTSGGTKIGTYDYMSPEVYHDEPYGSGTDIYSLGLVLYWLLNERRLPFQPMGKVTVTEREEARRKRFRGETLPPPTHGSEELKRIVLKACAYDPKDRYASAEDMLRDLTKLEKSSLLGDEQLHAKDPLEATIIPEDSQTSADSGDITDRITTDARRSRDAEGHFEDEEKTVGIFVTDNPKKEKEKPNVVANQESPKKEIPPEQHKEITDRSQDDEKRKQQDYEQACSLQKAAKTADDYLAAAFAFERTSLQGFKDCAERARVCRGEAEKLAKAEPERLQNSQRSHDKKVARIGIIAALMVVALALIIWRLVVPHIENRNITASENSAVVSPHPTSVAASPSTTADIASESIPSPNVVVPFSVEKVGCLFFRDDSSPIDNVWIQGIKRILDETGYAPYVLRMNVPEGDACYEIIQELINDGCNEIVSFYPYHEWILAKAAIDYPTVRFEQIVGGTGAWQNDSNKKNYFYEDHLDLIRDALLNLRIDVGNHKIGAVVYRDENSPRDLAFIKCIMNCSEEMGQNYILRTNNPEADDCFQTILELVDDGCDVIISDYGYHEPYMAKAAERFPGITFLQLDGSGSYPDVSNLYSISFYYYTQVEGPYLPGWHSTQS